MSELRPLFEEALELTVILKRDDLLLKLLEILEPPAQHPSLLGSGPG